MPRVSFSVVKPKNIPQSKDYLRAIDRAEKKTTNLMKRDFKATVRTWDHQVEFEVVEHTTGSDHTITVGTDDDIYGYVNNGTEPHEITPKKSRFLYFPGGPYKAKTRVGIIGSRAGGTSGATVAARSVKHPGSKARNFTGVIGQRRQKTFEQEISQNIAKVARKQA